MKVLSLIVLPLAALLGGCTVDVVPVHFSRVNSAKFAEQPLLRGPTAPRAFKYSWKLKQPEGNLFDPTDLEFTAAGVKFRAAKNPTSRERVGVFVLQAGPWFEALDSFREQLGEGSKGFVRYQLSRDNSAWYFFDGKNWVLAGPTYHQANSEAEINPALGRFHAEVGTGALVLKVFLVAPTGNDPLVLGALELQGIAPRMDGWN